MRMEFLQNALASLLPWGAGIVLLFFVCATIVGSLFRRSNTYLRTPLMTGNELEFFGRLIRALPDLHVFPQVSMAALVRPSARGKAFRPAFARISQKRVDWVVCRHGSVDVVAVVELDDRTHDPARDAARDAMLRSAGLQTLRFRSKQKPCEKQIREQVMALVKSK